MHRRLPSFFVLTALTACSLSQSREAVPTPVPTHDVMMHAFWRVHAELRIPRGLLDEVDVPAIICVSRGHAQPFNSLFGEPLRIDSDGLPAWPLLCASPDTDVILPIEQSVYLNGRPISLHVFVWLERIPGLRQTCSVLPDLLLANRDQFRNVDPQPEQPLCSSSEGAKFFAFSVHFKGGRPDDLSGPTEETASLTLTRLPNR